MDSTLLHSRHGHWRARYGKTRTAGSGGGRWKRTCIAGTSPTSYLTLGGKDNFAADRESGDTVAAAFPAIRTAARENRSFLRRAVTFLAVEQGVRQFLDIGTGIPTADNTHEVAQRLAPESRVVYVDNDPLVLVHARALLTSGQEGVTAYVDADLREPDKILGHADTRNSLDFTQPIALMLIAVLHFLPDEAGPYQVVSRLVGALPAGSYIVASHATFDPFPPGVVDKLNAVRARSDPFHPRTKNEFANFFNDLALVPPGIVSVAEWRADDEPKPRPAAAEVACYGAVARIP